MSKLKDSFKKLSFLGDYSSLIVPLILAMVAGLLFIPTILMQSKLKAEIEEESIRNNGNNVQSLLRLGSPSAQQWSVEEQYQDAFEQDAKNIELLAERSSRRELLRYNLLPAPPNGVSQLIYNDFGNKFRDGIEKMLSRLKARDCPTLSELQQLKGEIVTGPLGVAGNIGITGQFGAIGRKDEKSGEIDKIRVDFICKDIAQSISVYAKPLDISGYSFWENYKYPGQEKAIEDCWHWQLGYWIIEDIIGTVSRVNANSDSVLLSPVKRIVSLGFSTKDAKGSPILSPTITGIAGIPSIYSSAAGGRPSYVVSFKGSGEGLTLPLTARKCDKDIDVVHFKVAVVIAAKAIPDFLRELCSAKEHKFSGFSGNEDEKTFTHNQITILTSSYVAISPDDEEHKYYRYGEDGVIKLELICEYIFNKKSYEEVKPESVKKALTEALKDVSAGKKPILTIMPPTLPKQPVQDEMEQLYKRR